MNVVLARIAKRLQVDEVRARKFCEQVQQQCGAPLPAFADIEKALEQITDPNPAPAQVAAVLRRDIAIRDAGPAAILTRSSSDLPMSMAQPGASSRSELGRIAALLRSNEDFAERYSAKVRAHFKEDTGPALADVLACLIAHRPELPVRPHRVAEWLAPMFPAAWLPPRPSAAVNSGGSHSLPETVTAVADTARKNVRREPWDGARSSDPGVVQKPHGFLARIGDFIRHLLGRQEPSLERGAGTAAPTLVRTRPPSGDKVHNPNTRPCRVESNAGQRPKRVVDAARPGYCVHGKRLTTACAECDIDEYRYETGDWRDD